MIIIDVERCTGCNACVEVCPTGALYLVDGKATVDRALCRECEACLAVCPSGAISFAAQEAPIAEPARLPAVRPEPAVIRVATQPATVPFRARVLPVVGAALAWAGREILPALEELLLDTLDRHPTQTRQAGAARTRQVVTSTTRGGGRQYRHRRRGKGWG